MKSLLMAKEERRNLMLQEACSSAPANVDTKASPLALNVADRAHTGTLVLDTGLGTASRAETGRSEL